MTDDELGKLVRKFKRQIGYPEDKEGFDGLAEGIVNACSKHHIEPETLVNECLNLSPHCPTDFDLLKVAENLRSIEDMKNPPKPAPSIPPPPSGGRKCRACEGWGYVKVNGRWEFCACADGRDLRIKLPEYIDFCNSFEGPLKSQVLGIVRGDSSPATPGPSTVSKYRCAKCRDTGKLVRPNQVIWCTCPAADELKKQYRVTDYPRYRQPQIRKELEALAMSGKEADGERKGAKRETTIDAVPKESIQ